MYVWPSHIAKCNDQQGKVISAARGQLNRGNESFPIPFAPENLVSRDEFGSSVPRQPAHLQSQAEYGAFGIPPDFRGGVHSFLI